MKNLIQNFPKAELHLHIEGCLEPELAFELAKRNQITLPYESVTALREAYQFDDLQSFLNLYYDTTQVLLQEQDFYDLTWQYCQRATEQNIRHAEIFFDPQVHVNRGVEFATVINGIAQALKDAEQQLNLSSHLIPCFLRDLSEEEALHTLDDILKHQEKVIAVGLDSAEVGNPPQKFEKVFAKARANGLRTVAHAGEEGTAENIWDAINTLKVSRVDHGVKAIEDASLVDFLREQQLPLTVCPLSNVKLKVYSDLSQHPIKALLDQNVCVTINSDDPAYFTSYANTNYEAVQETFGLDEKAVYQLAKNSFTASFLDEDEKKRHLEELAGTLRNNTSNKGL